MDLSEVTFEQSVTISVLDAKKCAKLFEAYSELCRKQLIDATTDLGVLAARAGESGRGFSVVADNIKNLAEQSGDSANEIKNTIISSISDLSAVSEETSATNQEVSASAHLVAGNVSDVSSSMGNMNSSADELKGAIRFFKE